jgi:hypothetical protein
MGGSTPPLFPSINLAGSGVHVPSEGTIVEQDFIMYRRGLPTCDRPETSPFFCKQKNNNYYDEKRNKRDV